MNPFEINFGKEPKIFIGRDEEKNNIINYFNSSSQVYLITGIRGTGKTTLLSKLVDHYRSYNDWIVLNINPEKDILTSLVSKLYLNSKLSHLFMQKSFNIGIKGISLTLKSGEIIEDPECILDIMFKEIIKQNKKVLIAIDEISNNKDVKVFIQSFQIMIRERYPVYLLMTGLPENLYSLQNEKTLTFLYRAPKVFLNRLSDTSIYISYFKVFNDKNLCLKMTRLVNGYAFAYQLLGMIVYNNDSKLNSKVLEQFDLALAENSYSKIWSELNEMDKSIIRSIIKNNGKVAYIQKDLKQSSNLFSVYRKRLIDKGYLDGTNYGILSINLPRFDKFVSNYDFDVLYQSLDDLDKQ